MLPKITEFAYLLVNFQRLHSTTLKIRDQGIDPLHQGLFNKISQENETKISDRIAYQKHRKNKIANTDIYKNVNK